MEEIMNTAIGWFVPLILSAILGFLVKNYKDSKNLAFFRENFSLKEVLFCKRLRNVFRKIKKAD